MSEKINTEQKGDYTSEFELIGGSEKGEMEYKATGEISEAAKKRISLGRKALEAARLAYGER
ncbi:hypothetical protein IJH02_01945 [Candidatus Saccharibacteria bacterium]|nr:hypothetical protein [Candidatus Saccharibacteria bacterium]